MNGKAPNQADGVLAPLVAETVAARIADRFVTAIALGYFVVGQKLPPIAELAAMLEVSPTTVREAQTRLAALGYLRITRGRNGGATVVSQWGQTSDSMVRRALEPEWAGLEVTLDFRSLIEQQIARTAAERRTPEDVRRIWECVRAYAEAENNREASRDADLAFHRAVTAASHNPRLAELSLRLRHEVSLGFDAEPYNAEVRAKAVTQHSEIADAVDGGRAEDAAQLMATHLMLTAEVLRALYRQARPTTN
ncbi:MAG: FCD domain-containing protein [Bifidobacteriaceae bacterium]|jgi:DNA-binding FadR family transcriptional regulator|nr:FCD domain-containing protein [Bifidobacteriaceae bacterium]